jgi:hypothetical protein
MSQNLNDWSIKLKNVIKTEAMLSAFDQNVLALIKSCGIAFCGAQDEADEAVETYQRLLGLNPSYAEYHMARLTWREGIIEDQASKGKEITDNALNVRWNGFIKKAGIPIPKSDDAESIKKANQRAEQKAKEEAMFANMTTDDLTAKVDQLLKNHTKANLKEAGKYQDRIEKLRKEENKEEDAQKAQLVKDLTAWAKDQSYLELYTLCENLGVI